MKLIGIQKTILFFFLLPLLLNTPCFSQENKEKVVFFDECSKETIKVEHTVGKYEHIGRIIQYSVKRGKWFAERILISYNKNDTIKISRIGMFKGIGKNSKTKVYLNCDKLCNGLEKDYYSNGNLRLEGNFDNGIPIEIKIFEPDGIIVSQETYYQNSFTPKKTMFFDINGNLDVYSTYEQKANEVIIKNYDRNNKLINTEKNKIEN